MVIIDKKKKKGLCVAYRCMHKHTSRDRFCAKHSKRWQKLTNPIGYVFNYLRQNARRRGKAFSLTLEEFKTFCEETNYLELKGRKASSASIDRIDSSRGYSIDNIQILSLSENSKKGDCPF